MLSWHTAHVVLDDEEEEEEYVPECVLLEGVAFVFQQWYTATMNLLGTWLTERMDQQLHVYQLKILIRITKVGAENTHSLIAYVRMHRPQSFYPPVQKKYRDFRLQGVLDSTLNSKMYDTVRNRLTLEEATASVREGGMQGISMKDSDEEDDEDD